MKGQRDLSLKREGSRIPEGSSLEKRNKIVERIKGRHPDSRRAGKSKEGELV